MKKIVKIKVVLGTWHLLCSLHPSEGHGWNNQLSHGLKIVHATAGHLLQELEDNWRKPGKPMRLRGAFKVWHTNTTEYCQWKKYCKYMTRNGLHKKTHLNGTAKYSFCHFVSANLGSHKMWFRWRHQYLGWSCLTFNYVIVNKSTKV